MTDIANSSESLPLSSDHTRFPEVEQFEEWWAKEAKRPAEEKPAAWDGWLARGNAAPNPDEMADTLLAIARDGKQADLGYSFLVAVASKLRELRSKLAGAEHALADMTATLSAVAEQPPLQWVYETGYGGRKVLQYQKGGEWVDVPIGTRK